MLDNYLDQLTLSAKTIGDLDFPAPKIFTNALLGRHEITTLIRDTEPHERALYTVESNVASGGTVPGTGTSVLSSTQAQNRRRIGNVVQLRQSSTVAKVLGNEMLRQIQQSSRGQGKKGVNVEILLQGAERLCAVYAVTGANEKIVSIRNRHTCISESISDYEAKILKQQSRLKQYKTPYGFDEEEDYDVGASIPAENPPTLSEHDFVTEEEIKELEAKKKSLEERVAGMEKDLGGLLR